MSSNSCNIFGTTFAITPCTMDLYKEAMMDLKRNSVHLTDWPLIDFFKAGVGSNPCKNIFLNSWTIEPHIQVELSNPPPPNPPQFSQWLLGSGGVGPYCAASCETHVQILSKLWSWLYQIWYVCIMLFWRTSHQHVLVFAAFTQLYIYAQLCRHVLVYGLFWQPLLSAQMTLVGAQAAMQGDQATPFTVPYVRYAAPCVSVCQI